MSDEPRFKVGDLVWAKMKGYPPWPAKICEATGIMVQKYSKPKTFDKNSHVVFFFGTRNFSWMEEGNLKQYHDHKGLLQASKAAAFKKAVAEIDEFISTGDSIVPEENTLDFDSQDEDGTPDHIPTPKAKVGRKKKISVETNGDSGENAHAAVPKKRKTLDDGKIENAGPSRSISRKSAAHNLVNRVHADISTARKPIDVTAVSKELKEKNIVPSTLKFGFLGVGIMGSGMIKNLLNSGHQVSIWNRSPEKCDMFTDIGATHLMTPSDIVSFSDITFSCVSDPAAAKEMVFGNCGVLTEMDATKNYVEMTSMDPESSQDICDAIETKGGRYLEAQLQGSLDQAENGTLVVVAAGNKSLYDECETAFSAIAKNTFYVGPTGTACKINLALQMLTGTIVAGLAEAFTLADRTGLNPKDLLDILKETNLAAPLVTEKGEIMATDKIETKCPLNHMQKDLNLALQLGHSCDQPLPVAAAANESYKHAKRLGYGGSDVASVIYHARF